MVTVTEIETNLTPAEILPAFAEDSYPFFLDSGMDPQKLGRFSFLGSDPFRVLESRKNDIVEAERSAARRGHGDPFAALRRLLEEHGGANDTHFPFVGGAVGFLGYDAARLLERLPERAAADIDIPDCFFGFYDGILAFDHAEGRAFSVALGIDGSPEAKCRDLAEKVRRAERMRGASRTTPPADGPESRPVSPFSRETYMEAVERIREYIRAGDVYQVNMTQRFRCPVRRTPQDIYARLRSLNPAPFAAYLDFGEGQVLSSSPERFLKIRGGMVETRPIKGTRPRGATSEEDRANREELLASAKDRAELLMIVDLERNDLSRSCRPGSVKVPELFRLESYATVHHLVATVTGELEEGFDAVECVKAAFPGGSITGAPKIRAMEIIDELEPTRRNVYTGSIGYFGFDGGADLNIAIRTMLVKGGEAFFQVGGAVVWDSDPAAEYEETLHKGRALLRALSER